MNNIIPLSLSGLKQTIYLPGDKVSINCTSAFSFPAARLSWRLNSVPVDRWMVTSYTNSLDSTGLESATLGLNFLVLPEHFRGPEQAGLFHFCWSGLNWFKLASLMREKLAETKNEDFLQEIFCFCCFLPVS